MNVKVFYIITPLDNNNLAFDWIVNKKKNQPDFTQYFMPIHLYDISTIENIGTLTYGPVGVFLKDWEKIPRINEIIDTLRNISPVYNSILDQLYDQVNYTGNATLSNPNGKYTITAKNPPHYTAPYDIKDLVAKGLVNSVETFPNVGQVVGLDNGELIVFDGKSWLPVK